METIIKKVAHLKGMIEGMELDTDKKEAKLISAIADILEDLTDELSLMQEEAAEMADYVDELDCDLGDVEEYLWEEDDEDEFYCDGDCDDCDEDCEFVDDNFVQAECPDCGEKFCFEADCDPENIVCPNCGGHFTCVCQCDDEDADCNECVKLKDDEE